MGCDGSSSSAGKEAGRKLLSPLVAWRRTVHLEDIREGHVGQNLNATFAYILYPSCIADGRPSPKDGRPFVHVYKSRIFGLLKHVKIEVLQGIRPFEVFHLVVRPGKDVGLIRTFMKSEVWTRPRYHNQTLSRFGTNE